MVRYHDQKYNLVLNKSSMCIKKTILKEKRLGFIGFLVVLWINIKL